MTLREWYIAFDDGEIDRESMMNELSKIREELKDLSKDDEYLTLARTVNNILCEEGFKELYLPLD